MFSPEASASASQAVGASLRNPRRRRRIESETQRRPVKRSRIASDQFVPVVVNGHAPVNGSVVGGHRAVADMPVREVRVVSGSSMVDSGNVLVWRLTTWWYVPR
jgi:hypothetical protein